MRPIVVACEDDAHARTYAAALVAAGAPGERIQVFTPDAPPADAPATAANAAGVLLCGGPDVDPARYGEATVPGAGVEVVDALDLLDLGLLDGARAARVPVLGVCRGLQVIDVHCGGSLWQDLPSQRPGAVPHAFPRPWPRDHRAHEVTVLEEARGLELGELLGRGPVVVNSRHHQGIHRLGHGLAAVATSPDGLVEAIAGTDPSWWIEAVQWHPENMIADPVHLALFARFLAVALAAPAGER